MLGRPLPCRWFFSAARTQVSAWCRATLPRASRATRQAVSSVPAHPWHSVVSVSWRSCRGSLRHPVRRRRP